MRRGTRFPGHIRANPNIAMDALIIGGTAAVISSSVNRGVTTPASQQIVINNITSPTNNQ